MCNDNECATIYKTAPELEHQVVAHIAEAHAYDVPCIIRYPVACNESYKNWVYAQTLHKTQSDEA